MSFIDTALEAIEKAFNKGEDAVHDFTTQRHAAQLLLELGVAVYAEQRLGGTHEPVEHIFKIIDGYTAENGEVDLGELKAAHEVLSEKFIAQHSAPQAAEPAKAAH